ncbi:MAG: hypothetical protein [Cystoviridae sp.]|nr:MAG: hypothetical protein [Cystoviridae sp.]
MTTWYALKSVTDTNAIVSISKTNNGGISFESDGTTVDKLAEDAIALTGIDPSDTVFLIN